ncbi:MAG: hypothetical protein JSW59_13845, partial [Phycisphaerales bacterium]
MRKVLVGFISLGSVLAVYLLYTGMSDSPVIDRDLGADFVEAMADSNIGDFDSNVGKIGNIGIGRTEVAKYVTLNEETKEVESIWGFRTLLSKSRGRWELEKPYVNVYEPEFTCYITADSGLVQMETAAERTTPKDATFSGNVVIHVLPTGSSELKESFVYLDDIIFLSDRSQLYTEGPVEYVSDDVRMRGRGLELIYNDQSDRLEFFRIVDLESLRIKNYRTAMFSADKPETEESVEVVATAELRQPDEAHTIDPADKAETLAADTPTEAKVKEGIYYKCILSKNVFIDTPDELIFADQRIYISDIFWSRDSISSDASDANDAEAVSVAGQKELAEDVNDAETFAAVGKDEPAFDSNGVAAVDTVDPNVAVAAAAEPNTSPEGPDDIVITCDSGLVLVPMDTNRSLDEFMQVSAVSGGEHPAELETDTERTKFVAPRIDYNAVTRDVAADGESRLTLYSDDRAGAEVNEPP